MERRLFVVVALGFLLSGSAAFRDATYDAARQVTAAQGVPPGGSGTFTIPNLFGMKKEQTLVELKKAGHQGAVRMEDSLCGSVVEGRIIELGEVCRQRPSPGQIMGVRLPISITVQTEDPRHGNIGKGTEWRLMPDVRGMSVEQARQVLRDHGLTTEDRMSVQYVKEPGCAPGRVCRTYPELMKRSGLNDSRVLYVGGEPGAR